MIHSRALTVERIRTSNRHFSCIPCRKHGKFGIDMLWLLQKELSDEKLALSMNIKELFDLAKVLPVNTDF